MKTKLVILISLLWITLTGLTCEKVDRTAHPRNIEVSLDNLPSKMNFNMVIEIVGIDTHGKKIKEKIIFDEFKPMLSSRNKFRKILTFKAIPMITVKDF